MKIFHIFIGIIQALMLKIFPFIGYRGVINTQISIYNRLKKRAPEMPENELLNSLITSRMKAWPKVSSEEEYYYTELLGNPDKTLEDVIWTIVGYEYIQSRVGELFTQGYKMGLSTREIGIQVEGFKAQIKSEIKESIKKKVR